MLFGLVLHFMAPEIARTVVARYAELLAPSSYIVMSVGRADGDHGERLVTAYRAGSTSNPSRSEVASWLSGLDLVPPGMTRARDWVPGQLTTTSPAQGPEIWARVARLPGQVSMPEPR